jgi:hypothetical protein
LSGTLQKIECYPGSKIYLSCPAGVATGGPEALHQFGHHLILLGFNAFMYYYHSPESTGLVHENYKKYNVPYVSELENSREHVLIIPETHLSSVFCKKFSRVRKVVWWLSVANYYIILNQQIARSQRKKKKSLGLSVLFGTFKIASFASLKEKNVLHIGHSYHSMVHLRENGIEPVGQVSDYMNDAFFERADEKAEKEDIIIYNPKKNDDFLGDIMNQTKELNWKPLSGMSPAEVAYWMNRAKLYIDFGYHPGKERMPREACIMRCCMIIGKSGSAVYAEDMPIPEKYRFGKSKSEIPGIISLIKECLANYDKLIGDFEPYRKVLYREKEKFIDDISTVFTKAAK